MGLAAVGQLLELELIRDFNYRIIDIIMYLNLRHGIVVEL